MKELNKKELVNINGGINITGTLISSITKGISIFVEIGRSLGGAIRRIASNKICPL